MEPSQRKYLKGNDWKWVAQEQEKRLKHGKSVGVVYHNQKLFSTEKVKKETARYTHVNDPYNNLSKFLFIRN